ncbi:MAG: hypothetical protein JST40_05315 [Armatimonadetes bacterium]|nr:hypothetical protein [Armatimonadota bacterium]
MPVSMSPGAVVFVKNLATMATFYESVFGLIRIETDRTVVRFDLGGIVLTLHAIPERIAEKIEIKSPPSVREEAVTKLVFPVVDIEASKLRAEEQGGQIYSEDKAWEMDGIQVRDGYDPEGNVFQVRMRLS